MTPTLIAEHYVCLDELRKPANIADIGCRGFQFTQYFDQRGDFVIPVDLDFLPESKTLQRPYLQMALSNYNGICGIKKSADPQATQMIKILLNGDQVVCVTMDQFLTDTQVPYYDILKMDIEGAEFDVIMSMTKAPSKQLSWEAHLHTNAYGMAEVKMMELKLESLGYKAIKHELTRQHGLPENYWSSLWIRL